MLLFCRQIVECVETVQRSILEQEPLLKTALIRPATLHVTLAVLSINNEEELIKQVPLNSPIVSGESKSFYYVCRAQSVLTQSGLVFTQYLKSRPVHIHFGQVDHFASKVRVSKPIMKRLRFEPLSFCSKSFTPV